MNDMNGKEGNVLIEVLEDLNKRQGEAVRELQKIAFSRVGEEEARQDFYHPTSAQVLAHVGGGLVGWAGIHETERDFEGKKVKLGGYGICTHPKWQGRGIGGRVSQAALAYLKDGGCEVAFLSIDPSNMASVRLHQKNGFVMFSREFSWINSNGESKRDRGGMIAPVNSQEQFDRILNGKSTLFLGNGYW